MNYNFSWLVVGRTNYLEEYQWMLYTHSYTTHSTLLANSALTESQFKTALVGTGYSIQRQSIIGNALRVPWMVAPSWFGQVAQCRACIFHVSKWYLYRYPGT